MTDHLIPVEVRTAAKRGFIRTTAQALAAVVPLGTLTGAALSSADPVAIGWAALAAVVSSVAAGAASYLSILSKGIPEDYQNRSWPSTEDVAPEVGREPHPLSQARRLAP